MYYRVEVNYNNIRTVLETPFSLNPTRLRYANNPQVWHLLTMLVDISLQNNFKLFDVCHAAVEQNHEIAEYLPGIWEVLFERARPIDIPLRRTECAFFFEKKEDALRFKENYPGMVGAMLCEVEIIEEALLIKADMKWLDNINENTATAAEVIGAFKRYWAGEMTPNPVVEVLFVGKYKLNPIG
jgi:hypothetical protein